MKYYMIISNKKKVDNTYTEENYTNKWKRKKERLYYKSIMQR